MKKKLIEFEANEQTLTRRSGLLKIASGTINYLIASFELGANWNHFDKVCAIWHNSMTEEPVILDSEGKCVIPSSVLEDEGAVKVNLEGTGQNGRLTTYTVSAVVVSERVPADGEPTQPLKRE